MTPLTAVEILNMVRIYRGQVDNCPLKECSGCLEATTFLIIFEGVHFADDASRTKAFLQWIEALERGI